TAGRYSVTTRSPPGRVVRRNAEDGSPLCRPRRSGCVPGLTAGRRGIGWRGLRSGRGCVTVAGFAGFFVDEHQRDLATLVDVGDLHAQLVADGHDVLDLRDALALTEFGDVYQPVAAGQQRHERAEGGRLDPCSEESLAGLGQLRVGDRVDAVDRSLRGRPVGGADEHGAIVLDGDLRAGFLGDGVDDLALGTDHLADLVHRHLDRGDSRRVRAHLVGTVDGLGHYLENRQARIFGLA